MALPLSYLDIRGVEPDDRTRIQAVRIACDSEVHELDTPRFSPLTISAFDDVYSTSTRSPASISDLSRFLGVPLTARKLPLDSAARTAWKFDHRNAGAAALYRNCDVGSTLDPALGPFGSIPDVWAVGTGPVLVARVDKKPLHPLHLAAMSSFVTKDLGRLFKECMEAEQSWRDQYQYGIGEVGDDGLNSALWHIFERRRQVLAAATPERFEAFFAVYKAQRVRGRPELLAPWHEMTPRQRRESQIIELEEIEPRPEWCDVCSPLQV